jgi:type IV secretory pathway TrbF-like protein
MSTTAPTSNGSTATPTPGTRFQGDTPYRGARKLYNDVMGVPLRTIAWQKALILTLAGVLFLETLAVTALTVTVVNLANSKQVVAFGFDRIRDRDSRGRVTTEAVTQLNVLPIESKNEQLRDSIAGYWIPVVLESLFSVNDVETDRKNIIRNVRPFIAPGSAAVATIEDYYSRYNPVVREAHERVSVYVDPVPQRNASGKYHVTWTAKTFDTEERLKSVSRGGAYITLRWDNAKPSFEKLPDGGVLVAGNPVGMYISVLEPDQSLDPHATTGGSAAAPAGVTP